MLAVGGCAEQQSFDRYTRWDVVACTSDDDELAALAAEYPPADLGGKKNFALATDGDAMDRDRGALSLMLDHDRERIEAVRARLEADPRVRSTHLDATSEDACELRRPPVGSKP
jgi:hypothetical protein